jgi:hypothetical protein
MSALPQFSASDIPLSAAVAAHAGSSFVPEKRGEQRRAEYVAHLEAVRDHFAPLATTDELRAILAEELERYRQGYRARFLGQLRAASRTLSPMITGPSKFPTRRNEKALDAERRRWKDDAEWCERAQAAIRRRLNKAAGRGPISSDDPNAPEALRAKIAKLERVQEMMKAANAIVRRKKSTQAEKVAELVTLGLTEAQAGKLFEPGQVGGMGFASFQLTNNGANIRRLRQRLEKIERTRSQETREEEHDDGVRIVENVEDNRVQIFFPDKPASNLRARLKGRGFRWAPTVGAWQRQLTPAALYDARQIAGVEAPAKKELEPEPQEPEDLVCPSGPSCPEPWCRDKRRELGLPVR